MPLADSEQPAFFIRSLLLSPGFFLSPHPSLSVAPCRSLLVVQLLKASPGLGLFRKPCLSPSASFISASLYLCVSDSAFHLLPPPGHRLASVSPPPPPPSRPLCFQKPAPLSFPPPLLLVSPASLPSVPASPLLRPGAPGETRVPVTCRLGRRLRAYALHVGAPWRAFVSTEPRRLIILGGDGGGVGDWAAVPIHRAEAATPPAAPRRPGP